MTIPYTIPLAAGGAIIISTDGKKVVVVCREMSHMTRDEAEHVADALCIAGCLANPRSAQPIRSVDDARVRGNG